MIYMTSQYWFNKKKEAIQKRTIATKNKQELINYKKQVDDIKDHFSLLSPKFKKMSSYLDHVVVNAKPIDEGYLAHTAEEIDKCISITENYSAFIKQEIENLEATIRGLTSDINFCEIQYKYALREEQEAAESAAAAAAQAASNNGSSSSGGSSSSHRPSSRGACFTKGTKVLTIDGIVNIEDIKENMLVLTYNEVSKENEYKKVLKQLVHEDTQDDLYTITFDNYLLDVTASHRFYVNGEWVEAKKLKIDDELMYFDNTLHKIDNITSKKDTYYNLEVEDNHNYYVSDKGVLVHNRKMIE